jgi:hypothetical protein
MPGVAAKSDGGAMLAEGVTAPPPYIPFLLGKTSIILDS